MPGSNHITRARMVLRSRCCRWVHVYARLKGDRYILHSHILRERKISLRVRWLKPAGKGLHWFFWLLILSSRQPQSAELLVTLWSVDDNFHLWHSRAITASSVLMNDLAQKHPFPLKPHRKYHALHVQSIIFSMASSLKPCSLSPLEPVCPRERNSDWRCWHSAAHRSG